MHYEGPRLLSSPGPLLVHSGEGRGAGRWAGQGVGLTLLQGRGAGQGAELMRPPTHRDTSPTRGGKEKLKQNCKLKREGRGGI